MAKRKTFADIGAYSVAGAKAALDKIGPEAWYDFKVWMIGAPALLIDGRVGFYKGDVESFLMRYAPGR